ncbi:hypothetical protein LBMAG49_03790 [Planctomycetota bacterium]|jgi:flagellar motor protein MotB|nr:OmpA family protein [Planctomycetota bacterium]GDY01050.1 hypothetical protein LBMAG49_03790 [Planctomycetota bacterium]
MLFPKLTAIVSIAVLSLLGSCTSRYQDLLRDRDAQIRELNGRVASLRSEKEDMERQMTDKTPPSPATESSPLVDGTTRKDLQTEFGGEATVEYRNNRLSIGVEDTVTFSSGSHQLKDTSHRVLGKIASVLKRDFSNCKYYIEGHTDSDPIVKSKDKYDDNRDLSAKRANSVARYLIEQGVPENRVIIVGYGQFDPKDTKSKQSNRRVEIVPVKA